MPNRQATQARATVATGRDADEKAHTQAARPRPGLTDPIETAWPSTNWRDTHVVVAVSGGPDSVALLRTLHTVKQSAGGAGELIVSHYNHRLRGGDSDADAAWVASLCESLGVQCEVGAAPRPGADTSEQSARDARYAFLRAVAERVGARYLVTGHTADDQVETVLMRLLRGTGIAGLAGVPAQRALGDSLTVVRPLLACTRSQVVDELERLGQPYRVDATNADPRFTRNRVRHTLLPLLRDQFGDDVPQALQRLAEQASEAQAVVRDAAEALAEQAITRRADGSGLAVDRQCTHSAPPLVVAEAVKLAWRALDWPERDMGSQQWRQIMQMLQGDGGPTTHDLPGGIRARREGDSVRLARIERP